MWPIQLWKHEIDKKNSKVFIYLFFVLIKQTQISENGLQVRLKD